MTKTSQIPNKLINKKGAKKVFSSKGKTSKARILIDTLGMLSFFFGSLINYFWYQNFRPEYLSFPDNINLGTGLIIAGNAFCFLIVVSKIIQGRWLGAELLGLISDYAVISTIHCLVLVGYADVKIIQIWIVLIIFLGINSLIVESRTKASVR